MYDIKTAKAFEPKVVKKRQKDISGTDHACSHF